MFEHVLAKAALLDWSAPGLKLLEINSIVDWYLSWMAQVERELARKAKGPGSSPGPE